MKEQWKNIKGYEGRYQISNLGRVRSLPRIVSFGTQSRKIKGCIRKLKAKKNGYLFIQLNRDKKEHDYHIHRLVAESFVKGYFKGADVNHKDGNRQNNVYTNLEWCTRSQNILHSLRVLGAKRRHRSVVSISASGTIKKYKSIAEAARITGISNSSIGDCARHRRKGLHLAGSLQWEYYDKEEK